MTISILSVSFRIIYRVSILIIWSRARKAIEKSFKLVSRTLSKSVQKNARLCSISRSEFAKYFVSTPLETTKIWMK